MIGPWKMRPVATNVLTYVHSSPLLEIFTKRDSTMMSRTPIVFLENKFGRRRVRCELRQARDLPEVVRWLAGGELPPESEKIA